MKFAANATLFAVLVSCTVLAGCAQTALTGAPGGGVIAWDGAGRDPNLPPSATTPSRRAAPVREAGDTAAQDQDARLAENLVICRGCIARPQPPQPSGAAIAARQ